MATLIFDYDGTLHETLRIYAPAFRKTYDWLTNRGLAPRREVPDEEIAGWLGYPAKEMWASFLPGLPQTTQNLCSAMVGAEMIRLIEAGRARLYPGAAQVLRTLTEQGHTLVFLSNCKASYLAAHRRAFPLDHFFSSFYCTETFDWARKSDVFPHFWNWYEGDYLVIGDRFHDMEIARDHDLKSIGCAYGYGQPEELTPADRVVSDVTQLPDAVAELLR